MLLLPLFARVCGALQHSYASRLMLVSVRIACVPSAFERRESQRKVLKRTFVRYSFKLLGKHYYELNSGACICLRLSACRMVDTLF
jgi:hypothetical protein